MLPWLISFAAGTAAGVYLRVPGGKKIITSLLGGLCVFCVALFIMGARLETGFDIPGKAEHILLWDVSRSAISFTNSIPRLPQGYRVLYTARTLSDNILKAGNDRTALYDSISALRSQLHPASVIIAVSDFHDNASFQAIKDDGRTHGVILPVNPGPSIHVSMFEMPERTGLEEPLAVSMGVNSTGADAPLIEVEIEGQEPWKTEIPSFRGYKDLKLSVNRFFKGVRKVKITVKAGGSQVFQALRLVQGGAADFRLNLLIGRPSPESAAFSRLLTSFRWISVDRVTRLKNQDTLTIPDPADYQALVIFDAGVTEINNPEMLRKWKDAGSPVLYVPGIRESVESAPLVRIFTNIRLTENIGLRSVDIDGTAYPVLSAYENAETLTKISSFVLFTGFDTWKWDMTRAPSAQDSRLHARFWQNIVHTLFSVKDKASPLPRLNYSDPDSVPAAVSGPGIYSYPGTNIPFYYSPLETESPPVQPVQPDRVSGMTTLTNYSDIQDWSLYLKTKGPLSTVLKNFRINFKARESLPLLLLTLVILIMFWISSDRSALRN